MKKGKVKVTFSTYPSRDDKSVQLLSGFTTDVDVDEKMLDDVITLFHNNANNLQSLILHDVRNLQMTVVLGQAFINSNMMTLEKVLTQD